MITARCVLAAALLVAALATCPAAELVVEQTKRLDGKPLYLLSLNGSIEDDDAVAVERLLDRLGIGEHSAPSAFAMIYLNSAGGSWNAGVALAEIFEKRAVSTAIRRGAVCYSACAMAFLGGHFRLLGPDGFSIISRNMAPEAKLGFHAPFLSLKPPPYTLDDINTAFHLSLDAMTTVLQEKTVFNLNDRQIVDIFRTKPDDMVMIATAGDLIAYKIGVLGGIDVAIKSSPQVAANVCESEYAYADEAPVQLFANPTESWKPLSAAKVLRTRYYSRDDEDEKEITRMTVSLGAALISPALSGNPSVNRGVAACLVDFYDGGLNCRSFISAVDVGEADRLVEEIDTSGAILKNYVQCPTAYLVADPSVRSTWPRISDVYRQHTSVQSVESFTPIAKIKARLEELNR